MILTQSGPETSGATSFFLEIIPPAPPTGFRILDIGTSSFSVRWNPVSEAQVRIEINVGI